jgi:ankyrin repeat protein
MPPTGLGSDAARRIDAVTRATAAAAAQSGRMQIEVIMDDRMLQRLAMQKGKPLGPIVPMGRARETFRECATLILPAADSSSSASKAERLRDALSSFGAHINKAAPMNMGISVGIHTLLMLAALFDELECARVLIAAGARAKTEDSCCVSMALGPQVLVPGHHEPPHFDMAKLLIEEAGGLLDTTNSIDDGVMLATYAQDGNAGLVRFLIDHRADVNVVKANGVGPLFKAAQNGHPEALSMLINARANLAQRKAPPSGATPLFIAAAEGNVSCVKLLLAAGAGLVNNLTDDGASPSMFLRRHATLSVPEVVTLLNAAEGKPLSSYLGANGVMFAPGACVTVRGLSSKPHLNGSKGRVLEFDVSKGRFNVLLADGASEYAFKPANLEPREAPPQLQGCLTGATPVTIVEVNEAAKHGKASSWLRHLLARQDIDLDAKIPGPPEVQALGTHCTMLIVRCLSRRPLAGGEVASDISTIRILLEAAADPNATSSNGSTPLMVACQSAFPEVVEALISAGANVNAVGKEGQTALAQLCIARKQGAAVTIAKTLFDHGAAATLEARDHADFTALHSACEYGKAGFVRLLIEQKADVNVQLLDGSGYTALVAACMGACPGLRMDMMERSAHVKMYEQVVKMLLDAGANRNVKWRRAGQSEAPMPIREWVKKAKPGNKDLEALLGGLSEFDELVDRAMKLNVSMAELTGHPNAVIELTPENMAILLASEPDAAKAAAMKQDLLKRLKRHVDEAEHEKKIDNMREIHNARIAFDVDVVPPADALFPKEEMNCLGGRVKITGLVSKPELNGKLGRCVGFNKDGKRRIAIKIKDGPTLSVKPQNLKPVDRDNYPRCDFSSFEFATKLQAEVGDDYEILDYTDVAANFADPAHLLWLLFEGQNLMEVEMQLPGETAKGGTWPSERTDPAALALHKEAVYVQQTEANAHFFLIHRELLPVGMIDTSSAPMHPDSCSTYPYLMFRPGRITVPPHAQKEISTVPFAMRLMKTSLTDTFDCSICLESCKISNNMSQLPCIHYCCVDCMQKMWQHGKRGLKCPVCKQEYPNHSLEKKSGYSVIAEHFG